MGLVRLNLCSTQHSNSLPAGKRSRQNQDICNCICICICIVSRLLLATMTCTALPIRAEVGTDDWEGRAQPAGLYIDILPTCGVVCYLTLPWNRIPYNTLLVGFVRTSPVLQAHPCSLVQSGLVCNVRSRRYALLVCTTMLPHRTLL